jgi:predicted phosphodiesterase
MNPMLRDEQTREAREAVRIHGGVAQAARALNIARSTLDTRLRRPMPKPESFPEQEKEQVQEIAGAGLKAQVDRLTRELDKLRQAQEPKRVPVSTAAEQVLVPEDLWSRAEDECQKRIDYAHERSRFEVAFDKGPIAISFVSDQHIAPGTPVDFKRMREDAELISATDGLYACLAGDGVDNHIKIRPAALAARSQPHEQYELFNWYLGIFAEKIIALCSGNHDAWSDQIAGLDMVAWIAREKKLHYSPAEARIALSVGEQKYSVAFRHQYRMNSSFNQGHAVKQWYRMGEEPFDVGVIGHNHEASTEMFIAHGKRRWAARPGSYQITSAYSRQFGFNEAIPTCPTFLFYGDRRHIIGFPDLRDAIATLKAER